MPGLFMRMDRLETELRELRSSAPGVRPPSVRAANPAEAKTGLGPVASKIYFEPKAPWSAGLSAEFFSYHQRGGETGGQPNQDRANVGSLSPVLAVRLSPRAIFNTRFVFENGGAESSGSVTVQKGAAVVQMAYLDWLADDAGSSGLRVGHQLVPIGLVNPAGGEPSTYFGVRAPELERELIPTYWHENGLTYWLDHPMGGVQVGVFNSLDASGFRKDTFLAGGRSQGQNAAADDLMGAVRLSTNISRVQIGGSAVFGNSAQKSQSLRAGAFQLGEVHAVLNSGRLQLACMVARGDLQDADSVSILNSTVMATQVTGRSTQLAFDLIGGRSKLWVFARHSAYNLHARVPESYDPDPALNKSVLTTGLSYFPVPNLVVKMDYQHKRNGNGFEGGDFNLGAGIIF